MSTDSVRTSGSYAICAAHARDFAWYEERLRILRDWHDNRVGQALTLKRLMKLGLTAEKAMEAMKAS
jgi:signal transduction histidine kinase